MSLIILVFTIIAAQEATMPLMSYSANYGPYHANILISDPLNRPDFDNSKCGNNCWRSSGYDHYQRAADRAADTEEGYRNTFWHG